MAMITFSISYSGLREKNTVEFKSSEVVFGVVVGFDVILWSSVRDSVAGISTERSYLIDPVDIFPTLIPIVAEYDSLSNGPLNHLIQQK